MYIILFDIVNRIPKFCSFLFFSFCYIFAWNVPWYLWFYSVVFLYFFALITEEGFFISPCYSLELCILMGIYSCLENPMNSMKMHKERTLKDELPRSVQFSSVAQLCLTLWDPMNCSTPGLPVHHQLPESTQTHVHWVSDAIQPSHPLSSPFPPAPNPSQHQGLFKWVSSSHQVAKVLKFQLQSASVLPMNTQDWSPLGWTGWISLQSKGLSRVFYNTTVQKHQFFCAQLSL